MGTHRQGWLDHCTKSDHLQLLFLRLEIIRPALLYRRKILAGHGVGLRTNAVRPERLVHNGPELEAVMQGMPSCFSMIRQSESR